MTFESAQMLDSADKEFKAAIINMFKELKETMFKELKKGIMTVCLQRISMKR